jgi:hypothetical protein
MDRHWRTHCTGSTLARFESPRLLPVGTPKYPAYALRHRIVYAYQITSNYCGNFARMRRSFLRRVEACIESRGRQFEHLS